MKLLDHITRVIESESHIQPRNRLNLLLRQIKTTTLQILLQPLRIRTLRNNRNPPLRRPPQQHLRVRPSMLLRNGAYHIILQQLRRGIRAVGRCAERADVEEIFLSADLVRCVLRMHHAVEFLVRGWPEGEIGCYGDVVLGAERKQFGLYEVGMVLDLQD